MMLTLALIITAYPSWRIHVERYADGASAWLARLGPVIVKVGWRRGR